MTEQAATDIPAPLSPDERWELEALRQELAEAHRQQAATSAELSQSLAYQTATSDVLSVISKSPGGLEPVFQAMLDNAVRVCGASFGNLLLYDGEKFRNVALHNAPRGWVTEQERDPVRPRDLARVLYSVPETKRRVHIADLMTVNPDEPIATMAGARTLLIVPMLKQDELVGVIAVYCQEVRPFTEKQIELVDGFAKQAVIAIENARLLDELQTRQRELTESLEYQTAMAEVLGVISRSPSDSQPVFEVIARMAWRLCEAEGSTFLVREPDGRLRMVAMQDPVAEQDFRDQLENKPFAPDRGSTSGRAMLEGRTVHIHDVQADPEFDFLKSDAHPDRRHTMLGVPVLRAGNVIGVITLVRTEVKPFTARQIALVETFANQAVIAIENARLLDELQTRERELTESLDQQTATADVLKIISKSPSDLQPVLDAIVATAARLCEARWALVWKPQDGKLALAAHNAAPKELVAYVKAHPMDFDRGSVVGRAALDGMPVHIADVLADPLFTQSGSQRVSGLRTCLGVPLRQDGRLLGVMSLARDHVRPFSQPQIDLVATFAEQAVIAMNNAQLFEEVQERTKELTESLEYQTATSEVLGVIARSPGQLQPVLDAIARTAHRLCPCDRAIVVRREANGYRTVARAGSAPTKLGARMAEGGLVADRNSVFGRVVLDGRTTHVPDFAADPTYDPVPGMTDDRRTMLGVPLLRGGAVVGVITLIRTEVEPFSERQIALIETFADQAVIAIENARLFEAEQARTKELAESLEYQTATSEVLGVISRSPNELQPVLDAITETAVRLCEANHGHIRLLREDGAFHIAAHRIPDAELLEQMMQNPFRPSMESVAGRTALLGTTTHIADVAADPLISGFQRSISDKVRTAMSVPLKRNGKVVGLISVFNTIVRGFTERQIKLVETFADQAVIAINNVGLFEEVQARTKEVTEALEYQTATAEVLGVISKSPTQTKPVFDAIAEAAARLCGSAFSNIQLFDGTNLDVIATHNFTPEANERFRQMYPMLPDLTRSSGRAILTRSVVHIPDVEASPDYPQTLSRAGTWRSVLAVPMLRGDEPLGTITVGQPHPTPFTERQIKLLATFADQAVIAINNVQLFEAVQKRSKELTESLEYQTAISEVLGVISRSPNELQPVLDAIAGIAARLCGADWALIRKLGADGNYHAVAFSGAQDQFVEFVKAYPINASRDLVAGRALLERKAIHIADVTAEAAFLGRQEEVRRVGKFRSVLAVPLLRYGEPIGVIVLLRTVVRPFEDRQIRLIETFADQAVIAINNVGLFEEVQARTREVTEALEYQTATSEVLSVISSSPSELQPVMDAIVTTARSLCKADRAFFMVRDGDHFDLAAWIGAPQHIIDEMRLKRVKPVGRGSMTSRVAHDKRSVQIIDVQADPDFSNYDSNDPTHARTLLGVPLLRLGDVVGVIVIAHTELSAFTSRQIALVETFADQAVIAINNVGLFEEVQARTKDLARSVEELQSLGEVGRTVSSTLDMPKVLQTVLVNACKMAFAGGGTIYVYDKATGSFRLEAGYNMSEEHISRVRQQPIRMGDAVVGEAAERREAVQIADLLEADRAPSPLLDILVRAGIRAILAVPLLHQGEVLGALVVRRNHPGAFTPETVRLLETFAAQSAIAVHNARLFEEVKARTKEVQEALEYQTATSEMLSVISRSPNELQPVFDAIVETGVKLCEADRAMIHMLTGEGYTLVTGRGFSESRQSILARIPLHPGRGSMIGRALLDRQTQHLEDVRMDPELTAIPDSPDRAPTVLCVPLLRYDEPIGVITVSRNTVRKFSIRQVDLLETFASQAVIAINNSRLFEEVQARTKDLTRSVEELRALGEVGQAVSSSLDKEKVLQTVIENACRMAFAGGGTIYGYDRGADVFRLEAGYNMNEEHIEHVRSKPIRMGDAVVGECAERRETIVVEDLERDGHERTGLTDILRRAGVRAVLAMPLIHQDVVIGALVVRRAYPGPFTPETLRLLEAFAAQSAIAINNTRLFAEIQDKSRQLELASQHKSQFVANMSHELRTPLAAMLGYAELMKEGIYGELPEKSLATLERIYANGTHLLGLINSVLDLAKIEAGQFSLNLQDYAVGSMIETVRTATESLAAGKKLTLRTEVAEKLPHGFGDEKRLTQVLLNLVGNAIKFTDAGEVCIAGSRTGANFSLRVTDTGPGIPDAEKERIFEEFHQIDNSNTKTKGGTGLGLAISKQIIEMHGGRIWVESTVGKGSTFRIELPIRAEVLEEAAS